MKKYILICTALLLTILASNSSAIRGLMSWLNTPTTTRAEIAGKDGSITVTNAGTVVNKYSILAADAAAGSSTIIVSYPGGADGLTAAQLAPGDLLLIIQMQGAVIDQSDSSNYGKLVDLKNSGHYEFVTVNAVNGGIITINPPCGGLRFDYTAAGKVQVIRVPQYTAMTINSGASLTAPAWNGQFGGIVVVHVQNNAIINGNIDVSGAGFRGGALSMAGGGGLRTDYVTQQQDFGAEKGESIAGYQMDYDKIGGRYGRGAPANGGGGGTAHNSGGGGGANGNNGNTYNGQGIMDTTAAFLPAWILDPGYALNGNALTNSSGGGRGGYSYSVNEANGLAVAPGNTAWGGDNRREVGGTGGHTLPQDTTGRIFFGGGGGAGAQNNDAGGGGGNAGGLIFIIADGVSGTGTLISNGLNGGPTRNENRDGAGGAGSGGTIIVSAKTLSGIKAEANGGNGGNQARPTITEFPFEAEGPGGGGGGGFIAFSGGSMTTSVKGGVNGTTLAASQTEFPPNGATGGANGTTSTVVGPIPFCSTTTDLSITKTNGTTTIVPGVPFTYTIVAKNNGPNAVFGVPVTDNVPPVFKNVSWTCTASAGSKCFDAGGTGNINTKVDLLNGGTATYLLTVTADPSATGSVTNTAVIGMPDGAIDNNPDNNTSTDTDTITPQADLSITKTNNANTVTAGMSTIYSIVVTNKGPSAVTGATITDTIPPNLSGATWTCVASAGAVCGAAGGSGNISTTGNLLPGSTLTFSLTATVASNATGNVTNTATVAPPSSLTDPTPNNNSATDTDPIGATVDLAITKTDGVTTLTAGSTTTYTIVATNNGPSAITNATVVDTISLLLTNASWTCTASSGSSCGAASGNGDINTTVSLAVNGTATFKLTATVVPTASGSLANNVTISAPSGVTETNPTNNAANDTDTVIQAASVYVLKSASQNTIESGHDLIYSITAGNGGPSAATDVTVTDAIPPGMTVKSVSADQGTCTSGATVVCKLGTIAPNSKAVITIVVNIPAGYTPGEVANTAVVTTTTNDTTPNDNTSTVTIRVTSPPRPNFRLNDISVKSSTTDVCIGGGSLVNFDVKITNTGDGVQKDNPGPEFQALLPIELSSKDIICSATGGKCSVEPTRVEWNGEIQPGQSITISYRVRVRQDVRPHTRMCTDYIINFDSNMDGQNESTTSLNKCIEANCTPPPCNGPDCPDYTPGEPFNFGPGSIANDDKPGSILIYPLYISDPAINTQNTKFNITNINSSLPAYLHMFFIDGSNCAVADNFICLTPNQTMSFLATDLDPGIAGYLVVVAVDGNGCPTNFNYLIGDEFVKMASGHTANVGATAVPAINPPACRAIDSVATINFDGVEFGRLPRTLAIDNLPSVADGNQTMIAISSIGGDLTDTPSTFSQLFGVLYSDGENPYSFNLPAGGCQLRGILGNNFPRTAPRYSDIIPSGHTGWMKFWLKEEGAMLGMVLNYNNTSAGFTSGRNMHIQTLGITSIKIPIMTPACQ